MKKITFRIAAIFITSALLVSVSLKAQISVTQSNMFKVGDVYVIATASSPSVSPGPSGTNQTWNFSSLNSSVVDTFSAVSPGTTPYASIFPASNVAIKSNSSVKYEYYKNSASSSYMQGFIDNPGTGNLLYEYNPAFPYFPTLPATYNTKWNGTYHAVMHEPTSSIPGYDSEGISETGVYYDTIDAWGSITTPLGTFNSIRQKHFERDIDTEFLHQISPPQWQAFSIYPEYDEYYSWYSATEDYAIANIIVDSANGSILQATWLKNTVTGINDVSNKGITALYPNPAESEVTIKLSENGTYHVSILDIAGREVETRELTNKQTQLNTSSYSSGIYFYIITDDAGTLVDRGKFSVIH